MQEILELTEAQSERFVKAYDVTKLALEKMGVWPKNDDERRMLMELDELETGYPEMTLAHLYDVVRDIEAVVDKKTSEPYLETSAFRTNRQLRRQIIGAANLPQSAAPAGHCLGCRTVPPQPPGWSV